MNLSKQIKKLRERDHFSQEQLAEKIYVSRQTISNWENEKSYPDIHNLLLLSVLFKVSLDELVKGDVEDMKKEIDRSKWDFWSRCMLFFMVATPLSIAPAFRFFYPVSMAVPAVFAVIMLVAAWKVEAMKKQNNIKTYSEILAYMENKNADTEKIVEEKKHYIRDKIFMVIGCVIAALIIIQLGFVIFPL